MISSSRKREEVTRVANVEVTVGRVAVRGLTPEEMSGLARSHADLAWDRSSAESSSLFAVLARELHELAHVHGC